MIVEQGKEAVWKHAADAGLQDDIRMIAKYFDIKDVSIIYGGKMTYIDERPRKTTRIAVATKTSMTTKDAIVDARGAKRF